MIRISKNKLNLKMIPFQSEKIISLLGFELRSPDPEEDDIPMFHRAALTITDLNFCLPLENQP